MSILIDKDPEGQGSISVTSQIASLPEPAPWMSLAVSRKQLLCSIGICLCFAFALTWGYGRILASSILSRESDDIASVKTRQLLQEQQSKQILEAIRVNDSAAKDRAKGINHSMDQLIGAVDKLTQELVIGEKKP